jgi:syntaxin-binding protein 1
VNQSQTLRTFAQDRLLKEMIISADTESKGKNQNPMGYILILDDYTLNIVNSVVQYKDLIEQKIIGIEKIELKRKAFPKMHAIYFLEPKDATLRKVQEDVQAKMYESIHLYYTQAVPGSVFDTLKSMPDVISKLVSFKELNLDFLVIDDCTFTFKMQDAFWQIYNTEDPRLIDIVAQKLYTLISVFLPTCSLEVYTEKNSRGQVVGRRVMELFRGVMAKYKTVHNESAKSIKLVVLDRAFDVKTAAIHDFNYQSMVMDLGKVTGHTVELETMSASQEKIKRTYTLDESDELWLKYRFQFIADVMNLNSKAFNDFREKNSTAKFQTGQMKEMDLNKMQVIMRDMPQYTELLSKFTLHMFLIDKVYAVFQSTNLKQVGDSEISIATGVDSDGKVLSSSEIFALAIKELSAPTMSSDDRVRIAVLTMATMNLADKDYQKLKSLLADSSDTRVLENLTYLGIRNDPQGSTKSRLTDDEKKAYKAYAKDAAYNLSRYYPRLTPLLQSIMGNKLNSTIFSYECHPGVAPKKPVLSNDLLAFKTANISKGAPVSSKEKLIVFFLGGITYPEIKAAKEMGKLS